MKLEVGMYVRTKDGIIAKVDYIDDDIIFFDKDLYRTYSDSIDFLEKDNLERIIKASYNIIDILEVGDYVNNCLVERKFQKVKYAEQSIKLKGSTDYIYDIHVKSIVTKEQMEQMAYKVEE